MVGVSESSGETAAPDERIQGRDSHLASPSHPPILGRNNLDLTSHLVEEAEVAPARLALRMRLPRVPVTSPYETFLAEVQRQTPLTAFATPIRLSSSRHRVRSSSR